VMFKVSLKLARRSTTLLSTLGEDQSTEISKQDKRKRIKKLKKVTKKKAAEKKKKGDQLKPRTIGPNEMAVLEMRTGVKATKDHENSDDSDSDLDDLM
jgi:hypothetical protein